MLLFGALTAILNTEAPQRLSEKKETRRSMEGEWNEQIIDIIDRKA